MAIQAIQSHSRSCIFGSEEMAEMRQKNKYYHIIVLAWCLIRACRRRSVESPEHDCLRLLRCSLVVWWRLSRKPPQISTKTSYCQKLELFGPNASVGCQLSLKAQIYLHSNFRDELRKTHAFWNWVRNDPSRLSKVVNFVTIRKRVCDFLLVLDSF